MCILVFPKSIHRFQEHRSILGRYHEIDEWMACWIRPSIVNNTHSRWGPCCSNWLKNFVHLLPCLNQQCGSKLLRTRRHITKWSSFNEALTHLIKQWRPCNIEWDEVEVEKECNGDIYLFLCLLLENFVHWTTWRWPLFCWMCITFARWKWRSDGRGFS